MNPPVNSKTPPSPPAHWLWGHTKLIFKDPMGFPVESALKYKPICKLKIAGQNMYVTGNAECIKQIFLTQTDTFVKGPAFKVITLLAGNGLLNSEGEFWKRQRRLAQPAFHKDKLKGFLQSFIDCSKDLCTIWNKYNEKEVHKIAFEMGELTLRITGKTLFGIDLFDEAASVPPDVKETLFFLNKRIYSVPRFPISWPLPAHKKFLKSKERLDAVVYKIIDERIKGKTSGDDLLQTLLDATDLDSGEKMTREQLRDEVITLFLAGFETTSIGLTWVWYVLSQREDIRQKFITEIAEVVGEGEVQPEHLMQLPYTKSIIEEALRLYPPAYYIQRQLVKDTEMQGYTLKKNYLILTSVYALHKNPDYWQSPEEFIPERFNAENREKIIKGTYMPFGMGQRMCIGNQFAILEMIAVLAVMGRHFQLRPKAGYIPEMTPSITTNVTEGMPMHILAVKRC